MAQDSLVTGLIDDGAWLIKQLRDGGLPISAAWWVKPMPEEEFQQENQEWQFFLASPLVDQSGPSDAYEKAYGILKSINPNPVLTRIPFAKLTIIGKRNGITQAVSRIIDQFHGRGPIHAWHRRLGDTLTKEIFIYALELPTWQRVTLRNPVQVNEPSLRQSEAMSQIMASGNVPPLAGWPILIIPAGTEVNVQVLGTGADPDPFIEIQTLDGQRRGIAKKSDTEPVQASLIRNSANS